MSNELSPLIFPSIPSWNNTPTVLPLLNSANYCSA